MKTWIKSVSSNIKGIGEHELAPCVLVVGKNGDGKSALIDAVSLACCGEARSAGLGKREADLMRLAPPGESVLHTSAVLSNGATVRWETSGSVEQAKKAKRTTSGEIPEVCAVIASDVAAAVLLGSQKKLTAAILRASSGSVTRQTVLSAVAETHHPLLGELPEELSIAQLIDLQEKVAKDRSAKMDKIRALDKIEGTEELVPLSDEERTMLQRLEPVFRLGPTLEGVQNVAARAKSRLRDALELTQGEVGPEARQALKDRITYIDALITVASLAQKFGQIAIETKGESWDSLPCAICNRPGASPENYIASVKRVAPHREPAAEAMQALDVIEDCEETIHVCTRVLSNFEGAKAKFTELQRRDRAASGGQAVRGSKPQLEAARDALKLVQDALDQLVTDQLARESATIERRLNRFLPSALRARINVGANTCTIGMQRDKSGNYYDFRALSGAERATLIAAFASATISEDAAPVRLLIVDDTWLDAKMMGYLLKATAATVSGEGGITQAIICAVDWGTRKVPDGWHVIRLDQRKKRQEDDGAETA